MALYFDAKKQVFRINICKGGQRIRKSLPQGTTEKTAREIHARLLNGMQKLHHRSGEITGWSEAVEAAATDEDSWLRQALVKAEQRSRAARRPFRLSLDSLVFIAKRSGGRCEVSGLPFSDDLVGRHRPYRQSLDRIESTREYSIENCRLVCVAVNMAMGVWGEDVLHRIAVGLVLNRFYPPWLDTDSVKMHTSREGVRDLRRD